MSELTPDETAYLAEACRTAKNLRPHTFARMADQTQPVEVRRQALRRLVEMLDEAVLLCHTMSALGQSRAEWTLCLFFWALTYEGAPADEREMTLQANLLSPPGFDPDTGEPIVSPLGI